MSSAQPITEATSSGSMSEPAKQVFWSLPNTIEPIQVLPDRYTKASELAPENLKAKESDPGRMGVFVCLLDDKPHLHPSLLALHKHRLNIHKIPLPPDPANDLPIPQNNLTVSVSQDQENQVKMEEDINMSSTSSIIEDNATEDKKAKKDEWFMWKFSEEEENRRKSYLPLA